MLLIIIKLGKTSFKPSILVKDAGLRSRPRNKLSGNYFEIL